MAKKSRQILKTIGKAARPDVLSRGVSSVAFGTVYSLGTIPSGVSRAKWQAKADAEEIKAENYRHAANNAQRFKVAAQEVNFHKKQIADVHAELKASPYGQALLFNQQLQDMASPATVPEIV